MPANHGAGLHDDERGPPTRPEPPQHDPQQTVWTRIPPHQQRDLMAQSQILQNEHAVGFESRAHAGGEGRKEFEHHFSLIAVNAAVK